MSVWKRCPPYNETGVPSQTAECYHFLAFQEEEVMVVAVTVVAAMVKEVVAMEEVMYI